MEEEDEEEEDELDEDEEDDEDDDEEDEAEEKLSFAEEEDESDEDDEDDEEDEAEEKLSFAEAKAIPATTGAEATAGAGAVDNHRDITAAERTECITTTATGRSASAGACSAETEANCASLYESKTRDTHRVGQDENDVDFAASYSLVGEIHLCEWRSELSRCEAGQVVKVCPEESAAAGEPGHVVETSLHEKKKTSIEEAIKEATISVDKAKIEEAKISVERAKIAEAKQIPATTGAEATAGAGAVDNHRDITAAERTECITTTATGRSASAGACSAETEANCASLYESKTRDTHRVGQDENDVDFAASYSLVGEIHLCEWCSELSRCEAGQVVKVCPEESAAAGEPGHVVETSMEEEDDEADLDEDDE